MKCNAEERDDEEGGMIFLAETNDHRTPRQVQLRRLWSCTRALVRNNIC